MQATDLRTPAQPSVSALPATAALRRVPALPATATQPAVNVDPATATLPHVSALPAIATLLLVPTLPATRALLLGDCTPAPEPLPEVSRLLMPHKPSLSRECRLASGLSCVSETDTGRTFVDLRNRVQRLVRA